MPTRLLAALRVCSCLLCPYKDQTGRQVLAFPTGVALFPNPPSSLLPLGFRHTHTHTHTLTRTCSRLSRASVHVPLSVSVHALSPFYLGWKLSHDPPTTQHTRRPESTIWWSNLTHLAVLTLYLTYLTSSKVVALVPFLPLLHFSHTPYQQQVGYPDGPTSPAPWS